MKRARVYVTLAVFAGFVAGCFLLPLPVSRVHETGLVVVDPGAVEPVLLPEPARMVSLEVTPGQPVKKGQVLARFDSTALSLELTRAVSTQQEQRRAAAALEESVRLNAGRVEEEQLSRARDEAREAKGRADSADQEVQELLARLARVKELKAPRDGFVVTVPKREDVGKLMDKGYTEAQPVFAIGDPTKLVLKVPVSPQQFRVLKDDLPIRGDLDATVYVKGRSDTEFTGKVRQLPAQNAATVPIQLTQRGGGPLAVKPAEDPNMLIPLSQTYVVEVELTDPNATIKPGQLAVVKIHTKWRSAAWWVGQNLANALDIGFY